MRSSQGYTLMEMMVVVTIMAIMTVIAVPKYKQLQSSNKITNAANMLATDLLRARSESVLLHTDLHFVAVGSSSTDPWGDGWKIENQALSKVILKNIAIPAAVNIKTETTLSPADMVFHGVSGIVSDTANTALSLEFKICDDTITGEVGRSVYISQFGRVAIKPHADATKCN